MAWLILVVSGVLEAVWAPALSKSDGFTRLGPSVFVRDRIGGVNGRARGRDAQPPGRHQYAVWVGIGAVLTVAYAMLTGAESTSITKVLLIIGVIGCIVGLKLVSH